MIVKAGVIVRGRVLFFITISSIDFALFLFAVGGVNNCLSCVWTNLQLRTKLVVFVFVFSKSKISWVFVCLFVLGFFLVREGAMCFLLDSFRIYWKFPSHSEYQLVPRKTLVLVVLCLRELVSVFLLLLRSQLCLWGSLSLVRFLFIFLCVGSPLTCHSSSDRTPGWGSIDKQHLNYLGVVVSYNDCSHVFMVHVAENSF